MNGNGNGNGNGRGNGSGKGNGCGYGRSSGYDLLMVFDNLFADFEEVFKTPEVMKGTEIYHAPNFPPVNIYIDEKCKDLTFDFAVAGYEKEDTSIDFNGDKMTLSIKGRSPKKEGLKILKTGIKTAEVSSIFAVPVSKYDTENTKASINGGILTVVIPARDEIKPKKIVIS